MVHTLKSGAQILGAMALDFLEMANVFASLTPSVLKAALCFETLASSIKPLLEERVESL